MVFGKPISDLKFEDIQELQKNDVRESVVLEYKSLFETHRQGTDETLKGVSALANTFGGHILYGIKDRGGQHSGQVESIPGLDPIPNFKQTLLEWAVRWLYPPVTDIQVSDPIPVAGGAKVCYVVHVPASMSAPHFVETRKGCYIRVRVDEHSMTFEPKLATLDEILRLTDRRKAMIRRREELRRTALRRWEARGRRIRRPYGTGKPVPSVLLWAVPEFPIERLIEPGGLHHALTRANVSYSLQHETYLPDVTGAPTREPIGAYPWEHSNWFSQQDAVIIEKPGFEWDSHLEVSAFGSVLACQQLAHAWKLGDKDIEGPERNHLIGYPLLYMLFLRNLLRALGYGGPALVRVELRDIRGVPIDHLETTWGLSECLGRPAHAKSLADDTVSWEEGVSPATLGSDLARYAVAAYRRLAFAVGCRDAYERPDDKTILGWGLARMGLHETELRPPGNLEGK